MPAGALYPQTMANHAPPRSLSEYRLSLIARRLDLLRQQLDAKNHLARLGKELDDITAKLRALDEAVGK